VYCTHSDCITDDGEEMEGKNRSGWYRAVILLKENLLFLDDEIFIHAAYDEVWCIITDEKSGRFEDRIASRTNGQ